MAAIATTDALIARAPEQAAAAVRAIVKTQLALKADVARATAVGRKVFPPQEAELIAELIRRDLPYYDPTIAPEFVVGMNRFARAVGILDAEPRYEDVVATQFSALWKN
jgi:ABC-type nitrate/sulfonate/bicarbonate transport system substrate-binding protein